MVNGLWSMVNGLWLMVNDQRPMVNGQWSMEIRDSRNKFRRQKLNLQYIEEIEKGIEARSLLKHPFYKAWSEGTLTLEALADYSRQYYHHVAAFPTYLSRVHSITSDIDTRRKILDNLNDEEAGRPNHPELWLMFANSLGVTDEMVKNVELYPETAQLIDRFLNTCSTSTTAGLTALYSYESQIPAVAETKIDGLKKFYGIDDPKGLAYFKVHIEADKEHSAVERNLLADYISESNQAEARGASGEILDALYVMLDGICKRHGIAC
jgi:pyrroloquinoline-quinone synthase